MKRVHLHMNISEAPGFKTGLYTEKAYLLAAAMFERGQLEAWTCGRKPRKLLDGRCAHESEWTPCVTVSGELEMKTAGVSVMSDEPSFMKRTMAIDILALALLIENKMTATDGFFARLKHMLLMGADLLNEKIELRKIDRSGHAWVSFKTTLAEIKEISSMLMNGRQDGQPLNPMEQMRETMLQLQFDTIYKKRGQVGYADEMLAFYHKNFPEVEEWKVVDTLCLAGRSDKS